MNHKENEEKGEECPWCENTGDISKNNGIFWGAVLLIVLFLAFLYVLSLRS